MFFLSVFSYSKLISSITSWRTHRSVQRKTRRTKQTHICIVDTTKISLHKAFWDLCCFRCCFFFIIFYVQYSHVYNTVECGHKAHGIFVNKWTRFSGFYKWLGFTFCVWLFFMEVFYFWVTIIIFTVIRWGRLYSK